MKLNNKGITLIEILATIIILSIVSTLSFQVLNQGQTNYERVKLESELRDEADFIMASLIKNLFTVKESELQRDFSGPNYIINVEQVNNDGSTIEYETGIKNGKVIVKDQVIEFYNESVKLTNASYIVYNGQGLYEINIQLSNKKKNMTFSNTINTIYDKVD